MRTIIPFAIFIILAACSIRQNDPRLEEIASIVADHPEEATSRLDSIDRSKLNSEEMHYYDLLSIKAKDKAYVTHQSDSIILSVIDYYASHDPKHYAEALYYGGRVYSDLGDYPTALKHFQSSLQEMENMDDMDNLKDIAMSQTARLLSRLGLYEEALQYLNETIRFSQEKGDTVGLVFDLELEGSIYMHLREYDKAEPIIKKAINYCKGVAANEKVTVEIDLAAVKYHKGEIDTALAIIRPLPNQVHYSALDAALVEAARIYKKAGILDTAYIYAKKLVKYRNDGNHRIGYEILLSPEIRHMLPPDSIDIYMNRYADVVDNFYKKHASQEALMQRTLYNYGVHERERERAQKASADKSRWLLGAAFTILILIIIALYLKNRNSVNKLNLKNAIEIIEELNSSMESLKGRIAEMEVAQPTETPEEINSKSVITSIKHMEEGEKDSIDPFDKKCQEKYKEVLQEVNPERFEDLSISEDLPKKESVDELKEELRKQVSTFLENVGSTCVSPIILEDDAYKNVVKRLEEGKPLAGKENLWEDLRECVERNFPQFNTRLQILIGKRLKPLQYQVAVLMKCGFSPNETGILLCKERSTITYYRKFFITSICHPNIDSNKLEDVMRFL